MYPQCAVLHTWDWEGKEREIDTDSSLFLGGDAAWRPDVASEQAKKTDHSKPRPKAISTGCPGNVVLVQSFLILFRQS